MKKKKLPKRLLLPQTMDAPEREYYRFLVMYHRAYMQMVKEGMELLFPLLKASAAHDLPDEMRHDSQVKNFPSKPADKITNAHSKVIRQDANVEKGIKELFESVQNRLMKLFPDSTLRQWAQQMIGNVNNVSKKNIKKVTQIADLEIEPLMRDGELTPYFDNVVDENVGLIRSIPKGQIDSFKNALVSAITQDLPQDKIRKIIQKNFDVTRDKARLLARDQTNKLNGRLNQYRQQQLGGKRYRWRTSGDERVRVNHKKVNGKTFYWSDPPKVGTQGQRHHPGQDFQCRCHAEMVLDDILEE